MKKYFSILAIFALLVSFNLALAKEEGSTEKSGAVKQEEVKKQLEQKREILKKELEARKAEAKQKMEALKASLKTETDAVKAKLKETRLTGREKALERFEAAILRMSSLKERVFFQITKFEARGIETDDAKAYLETADSKLNEAKLKTADATLLLSGSVDKLSAENKEKLRIFAQETQKLIVEARLALNNAVKSLKESIKTKSETEDSSKEAEEEPAS